MSNKICKGCGVVLQSSDAAAIGYTPKMEADYCQRCFRIRHYDDVVISIFVNGPRLNTLPVKVYTQLKTGVTPEINALCTIILAAIVLVLGISSLVQKRQERRRGELSER